MPKVVDPRDPAAAAPRCAAARGPRRRRAAQARDQKLKQNKGCPDATMADKTKPGRGIELPFVEFFADKPFRLKFNPFVTGGSIAIIWCRAASSFHCPAPAAARRRRGPPPRGAPSARPGPPRRSFIIYTLVSPAQAFKEWSMWFDWIGDEDVALHGRRRTSGSPSSSTSAHQVRQPQVRRGDDAEPEFSKLQWFGMMYTCGVAVGLFYFRRCSTRRENHGGMG